MKNKIRLIAATLLVFSSNASVGQSNLNLSVMSYNILRPAWSQPADPPWSNRMAGIAVIINTWQPDIVGVQEEDTNMVAGLMARLPDYDYLFPVQINGAGILFRRAAWRSLEVNRRLTVDGRWITEALFEGSGQEKVYVYCVHLSPFEEWKRMMGAEILRHMISARAQPGVAVIVMGDLNATAETPPVQWLLKPGRHVDLQDPLAPQPVALRPPTSNSYGTWKRSPPEHIDYILHSAPLKPVYHTVVYDQPDGFYPSDHLPVFAVFEL